LNRRLSDEHLNSNEGAMSILIDENTTVIIQGLSGFQAKFDTEGSIRYGTKVVAGVVPGRGGETVLGLPIYNTVAEAVERHNPDASVVYVPARGAKDAICEAAQAGVKLILTLTEKIPNRDFAEAFRIAKLHGARLLGPNCNGVISPGRSKIGILGNDPRYFIQGQVGIMSRSGGMIHEICNLLTRAGIGQSTAVSIGGDAMVGTIFSEGLELFEADEQTKAVVMYCEPGGRMEEDAAQFIADKKFNKPVVVFIAGKFVENMPGGMPFGHAGAIIEGGLGKPSAKIKAFRRAGVRIAERLDDIPAIVTEMIG
jgi:succinyl-CoA synthetase alpha subunit